jgi:hypothetical protein
MAHRGGQVFSLRRLPAGADAGTLRRHVDLFPHKETLMKPRIRRLVPLGLAAVLALPWTLPAADPAVSKSALESDPSGWKDLLKEGLGKWKRVPIPPTGKLKDTNPWSVKDSILHCAGKGAGHEMLLYDQELGDGIFHVEWRFEPVEGKMGYNSGVYVRNSADGAVWHQAQVGNKNVGYLFGETLVDGQKKRFTARDASVPQRGKGPGEWNVFELTCKGKDVTLWVNGAVTVKWADCQVPKGYLGVEAEGWNIDFKNVRFKEAK